MKRRDFLKTAGTASLAAPLALAGTTSASTAGSMSQGGLTITWLGSATMLLTCGDLTLLTDPCFGEGDKAFKMGDPNEMFDLAKGPNIKFHRRLTPFQGIDLDTVDHVLVSHMHEDHFDQEAEARLAKNIPMMAPTHDLDTLTQKGFSNLSSLAWGEKKTITKGDVTVEITAIRADHSENPEIAAILGEGNGYWLTFNRGDWSYSVYWGGDTFGTKPVVAALEPLGSPDLFIPHLGSVGTTGPLGQISMNAGDVAVFAALLKPKKILPLHHSTYELYLEPIHHLAEALDGAPYGLDLVSEGTPVTYT
ncbi:MBL fold metallo-hydrolase [Labrenzia sp. PHM005]|uniref:MBL fold metallo-hydrolase n=1 Tax=Labrenzia sp. PHM005 TaxID=2590016 RepID=UPI00113FDD1A|nr:MBL fold metallo-hydrolase [Labrenzia sp. PHM005]QDG75802.1 MBL fold metallo-hydrolase [Labrenzia sp. PHM005]